MMMKGSGDTRMSAQEETKSRIENKAETKERVGLLKRYGKLDTKKKIQYAAILLIVAVILAIYFASVSSGRKQDDAEASPAVSTMSSVSTSDSIAQKLQETLSAIEGRGAGRGDDHV